MKTEIKNLLNSIHTIALSKGIIFAKNANFLQKKVAGISKVKEVLVLKGIFSEPTYASVLT